VASNSVRVGGGNRRFYGNFSPMNKRYLGSNSQVTYRLHNLGTGQPNLLGRGCPKTVLTQSLHQMAVCMVFVWKCSWGEALHWIVKETVDECIKFPNNRLVGCRRQEFPFPTSLGNSQLAVWIDTTPTLCEYCITTRKKKFLMLHFGHFLCFLITFFHICVILFWAFPVYFCVCDFFSCLEKLKRHNWCRSFKWWPDIFWPISLRSVLSQKSVFSVKR